MKDLNPISNISGNDVFSMKTNFLNNRSNSLNNISNINTNCHHINILSIKNERLRFEKTENTKDKITLIQKKPLQIIVKDILYQEEENVIKKPILTFDVLSRIFLYTDNPYSFSLVCKEWNSVSKSTIVKVLWFLNRVKRNSICAYLFFHPIYHVHLDAKFLKILLKHGAILNLHFLEQAVTILRQSISTQYNSFEYFNNNKMDLGLPIYCLTKSSSINIPVSSKRDILHDTTINYNMDYNVEKENTFLNSNNISESNTKNTKINSNSSERYENYYNNNNNKSEYTADYNELNEYANQNKMKELLNSYTYYYNKKNKNYNYHYHPSLLYIFTKLYESVRQSYATLVHETNTIIKIDNVSLKSSLLNNLLIEVHPSLPSVSSSNYNCPSSSASQSTLLKQLLSDTLTNNSINNNINIGSKSGNIVKTIKNMHSNLNSNYQLAPAYRNFIHTLVYKYRFIPYKLINPSMDSKCIRSALQFMEVIWMLDPEVLVTWIKWGWCDIDGEIPLVLFATCYDCKMKRLGINQATQSLHEHLQFQNNNTNNNNNSLHQRQQQQQHQRFSQLIDFLVDNGLRISNDTLDFMLTQGNLACTCSNNRFGVQPEIPCNMKKIIKIWNEYTPKDQRISYLKSIYYKSWSRQDGIGLYKMDYYNSCFSSNTADCLIDVNKFVLDILLIDKSVIFKQDMIGWIINHCNSIQVKKAILYILFSSITNEKQNISIIKLALNYIGEIDLHAIDLLNNIDVNNPIWNSLYPILIIHLYRRYVRRRLDIDPILKESWSKFFLKISKNKVKLSPVQVRFQDELFELLEVY